MGPQATDRAFIRVPTVPSTVISDVIRVFRVNVSSKFLNEILVCENLVGESTMRLDGRLGTLKVPSQLSAASRCIISSS